jgi:hypothetical protein
MGRIRALPLALGALAAVTVLSGATGSDPSTPRAVPGHSAPYLGTAVVGNGGLLAAVDPYGDLVDIRFPGPADEAQIDNPFARQAAGSVSADTGVIPELGVAGRPPQPLWRAEGLNQRYVAGTNVLRTRATLPRAAVTVRDAAVSDRLWRGFDVSAESGTPLRLRLDVNLDLGGGPGGDSIRPTATGFAQRDGGLLVRCRTGRGSRVGVREGGDVRARVEWSGRGSLRAGLECAFGPRPGAGRAVMSRAATADRLWIKRRRPLGDGAPAWAQRMYARSLLVLRALTDARSGASVAAARDHWAYVWPRDAGAAAIALAEAGYGEEARRIARFLRRLDLASGARFRGDRTAVDDGRVIPGDAAGWVSAAARWAGIRAPAPQPGEWRDRGDYGERHGDRGDYLPNAIAGGAPARAIGRRFLAAGNLHRRSGDPGSGYDSAVAWAVRPFPRPALYPYARRSLLALADDAGRFGLKPTGDWPSAQAWTAPAAWSAWSLAALGGRRQALRLLAALRRASTPAGTIPERVDPETGVPRSATPLGWSHAFTVLALRQLYPR